MSIDNVPQVDIKSIREGLQMTQAQFAAALGNTIRTVSRWETGRAAPTNTVKKQIAELQVAHEKREPVTGLREPVLDYSESQ